MKNGTIEKAIGAVSLTIGLVVLCMSINVSEFSFFSGKYGDYTTSGLLILALIAEFIGLIVLFDSDKWKKVLSIALAITGLAFLVVFITSLNIWLRNMSLFKLLLIFAMIACGIALIIKGKIISRQ